MIDNHLLLFIEPKNIPSKVPLVDDLTKKMVAYLRKGVFGVEILKEYSGEHKSKDYPLIEMPWNEKYDFTIGNWYMGCHNCVCGVQSECFNFIIPSGDIVNSLCVHYMAFHREEIPQEQLDKIREWADCFVDDIIPKDTELLVPKNTEGIGKQSRIEIRGGKVVRRYL